MSIPAQGRRSVLFPPPGVKIRRTIETFALTGEATMIAEHDPRRVLLYILGDSSAGLYLALAGSKVGLATAVSLYAGDSATVTFWGPEEVWAQMPSGSQSASVNVLIQSVFYD